MYSLVDNMVMERGGEEGCRTGRKAWKLEDKGISFLYEWAF